MESIAVQVSRSTFATQVYTTMNILENLDYENWTKWKLDIELILGLMDIDIALYEDKPMNRSPEERSRWEKSNRLSLRIMQSKMSSYTRMFMLRDDNVRDCVRGLEDLVMKLEKDGTDMLFAELCRMKYSGEGNVTEHILKMCHIVKRMRDVNREMDDGFLVTMLIRSLPSRFDAFKEFARTKTWKLDDFMSTCTQIERLIRNDDGDDDDEDGVKEKEKEEELVGKKRVFVDDNGKKSGKNGRVKKCFSCGREGHLIKDCKNSD